MRNLTRGFLLGAAHVAIATCLAFPLSLALPAMLEGQTRSLSWTETTRLEAPGALGVMLRAMPGARDGQTTRQAIHLRGPVLVHESDGSVTVLDGENRRFISVDHDERTYTVITFDEAAASARELSTMMAEAGEQEAAQREMEQATEEARAELTFRISADHTGQTRGFGSAGTASQHFVLAELEVTAPPEGVEDVEEGSLVFLVELWQSRDLPTADALYQDWAALMAGDPQMHALARDMAEAAESSASDGAMAMATWDPRVSAGMMELAEAMQEIDGTTVQSVVTIAAVPSGVSLDRDELVAWEPASMGSQLRGQAAGAARDAAAGAARDAVRGLTGRLGGRRGQQPAEASENEDAVTRPMLRMTTTREDVVYRESGDDVLGALMGRIEGYRQLTLEDLRSSR